MWKKKKVYKEGDIIAKLTKRETTQIRKLAMEKVAIKASLTDLMEKVIDLETENLYQIKLWWDKTYQKYGIPEDGDKTLPEGLGFTAWHNTGELQVRKKRRER